MRDTLLMLYGIAVGLAVYPGLRALVQAVRHKRSYLFTCETCGLSDVLIKDRDTYETIVISHLQYHINQTRRS